MSQTWRSGELERLQGAWKYGRSPCEPRRMDKAREMSLIALFVDSNPEALLRGLLSDAVENDGANEEARRKGGFFSLNIGT